MSWIWLALGAVAVGAILYLLIYAEDHWLDNEYDYEDEIYDSTDNDSTR